MKKLIAVAALATLAACSQAETAPPAEPAAEATAEPAAAPGPVAADGKPSAGKYTVTAADGTVFTEEVKADGTYVQTDKDGKVVETGKWAQKSPSEYCYTPDTDGAKEECNTEGVDAAGKWTSTNPKGETATVERVG